MMKSKITGGPTELVFSAKVLNKYDVKYYKCLETGFLQTEEPYWLSEAYSSAITKLDLGLPSRNEELRDFTVKLLHKFFDNNAEYLDYAGGYGLFTRLMRDKGFNFYHTDKFCLNMFAEYFDLKDIGENRKFELVTAFEVFEHMTDPLSEIKEIASYTDNLLFTTVLQPHQELKSAEDWWYFIPETGQHVSLYTADSLEFIAKNMGYNFYSDGISSHIFTKQVFAINPFKNMEEKDPYMIRKIRKILRKFDAKKIINKESLLMSDWSYVKSKIG